MSNYEFWDELGKIFNAVVAYQEKSVEFNKRFINPWIRLGNVFDKQDRNREAVAAYQKAIEIDPANAQNWCDLGNAYFRTEAYDQAIHAFQKAIEVDPQLGWPYSNLALAYVTQDDHEQAIFLYQKSIELLQDSKDKAVSWNRLGNLYRKLNEYDLAVQAFQKADELDKENAGFRDELDEIPAAPAPLNLAGDAPAGPALEMVSSPIELIVEQSQVDEADQAASETVAAEEIIAAADGEAAPALAEPPVEAPAESPAEPVTETAFPLEPAESAAPETELVPEMDIVQTQDQIGRLPEELAVEGLSDAVTVTAKDGQADAPVMELGSEEPVEDNPELAAEAVIENPDVQAAPEPQPEIEPSEPAPVSVQEVVETFTESIIAMNTTTETTDVSLVEEPEQKEESAPAEEAVPVAVVVETSAEAEAVVVPEPIAVEEPAETVTAPEEPAAPESVTVALETPVEAAVEMATPAEAAVETELPAEAATSETGDAATPEAVVEVVAEEAAETVEAPAETEPVVEQTPQVAAEEPAVEPAAVDAEEPSAAEAVSEPFPEPAGEQVVEAVAQEAQAETVVEEAGEDPEAPQNAAYEEFLKDDGEALNVLTVSPEDASGPADGPVEPVTKLDDSGELQIEMDTKNAHVWNELGNVYFNNGAVDDSIIAYSKAIELDRWFAWPYSNLALAYVQKGRFPEAVLLYQRSIELFSGEKDKAVSWNRLGNVYRRMNDYEHAIEAYQRADELDPDNTTLSLQSRFSLLGSYQMEQNASYAA